jgi:hypothetical protein
MRLTASAAIGAFASRANSKNLRRACAQHAASIITPGLRLKERGSALTGRSAVTLVGHVPRHRRLRHQPKLHECAAHPRACRPWRLTGPGCPEKSHRGKRVESFSLFRNRDGSSKCKLNLSGSVVDRFGRGAALGELGTLLAQPGLQLDDRRLCAPGALSYGSSPPVVGMLAAQPNTNS